MTKNVSQSLNILIPNKGTFGRRGRLRDRVLAFILANGLKRFRPSMIIIERAKKVMRALRRLEKTGLVKRVGYGYYEANLDAIKAYVLEKLLDSKKGRRKGIYRGPQRALNTSKTIITQSSRDSHPSKTILSQDSQTEMSQDSQVTPTSQEAAFSLTIPHITIANSTSLGRPLYKPVPNSVLCTDRKISKNVKRSLCTEQRVGVVIEDEPLLREVLYDNVRGMQGGKFKRGDVNMMLRAEHLSLFSSISYSELSTFTYSDYLEGLGVVKLYYGCSKVAGKGLVCSDKVEWIPPSGFIKSHGIAVANYLFRRLILRLAEKVLWRARRVLDGRLEIDPVLKASVTYGFSRLLHVVGALGPTGPPNHINVSH